VAVCWSAAGELRRIEQENDFFEDRFASDAPSQLKMSPKMSRLRHLM
jgi:hypothetical protein